MTDEWLEDTIYWCATFDEKEFIQVNRTELLTHLEDLKRLRELQSCQCTGVQKMAEYGLCFKCGRKVEVK